VFLAIAVTVLVPALLVVAGALVLGRRRPIASGDFDSDSVSFAGGIVSALFTVVLAFYIVFAWQTGADVDSSATVEADALIDVHRQADSLPGPDRDRVQDLADDYAGRVADVEWPALADGHADDGTADLLDRLRTEFTALPVDGGLLETVRDLGLQDLRQVDENRRSRIDLATGDDAFTGVLLAATIVGAALTMAFPLLVGVSTRPANIAVIAVMALVLGTIVFLSLQLDTPLSGPFGTGPSAFQDALAEMQRGAADTG
jgi:Protein of unknown function (DUF4239)